MGIVKLLDDAKNGNHPSCFVCPWSPKNGDRAFGKSCVKHGVDWENGELAHTLQIVQDPGNTTPSKTGKLCFVCNSEFHSDKTAQNNYELWKAAVSLNNDDTIDPYLKNHYLANSIMHGEGSKSTRRDAHRCCRVLIREQIELLQPTIIICSGKSAVDSLWKLRLIKKRWDVFKSCLDRGAYIERPKEILGMPDRMIICTYHTASQVVNQTVGRLCYREDKYNQYLEEKMKRLPSTSSVKSFLEKYNDISNNRHKGLRVLLLHWLDIGFEIRKQFPNG